MSFDVVGFNFVEGLTHFLKVFGGVLLVALVVSFLIAFIKYGAKGPGLFFKTVGQAFSDFAHTSLRRVWAVAWLTWMESTRKKALFVFVVFALLIMFAGWFLGDSGDRPEAQLKNYVKFVLTSIAWLTMPLMLLLACWGLPTDIKNRSLHTVITKPVRRHEVVLGRFFGFTMIATLVMAVMGGIGYFWTVGMMPEEAQDELVGRVPVYGQMAFSEPDGERPEEAYFEGTKKQTQENSAGKNVGDIWEFRSYIEGGTKSRTFYDFENLDVEELRENGELAFEYNFEAFRTHKGDIDQRIGCRMVIVNQESGLRIPLPVFEVKEFSSKSEDTKIVLGGTPEQSEEGADAAASEDDNMIAYFDETTNEVKSVHLFDELLKGGDITVEVQCLDPGQFIGMARPDLFIRMPDHSFASAYFKALFGIWLQMLLVIVIGVTASCFVKGPVATLLTFGFLLVGTWFGDLMRSLTGGEAEGGGPFESAYRMFMHLNPSVDIDSGPLMTVMTAIDQVAVGFLWMISNLIPQFKYYDMIPYVANGFDVPWQASLLPSILVTVAFIIPCLILGYFSMQLREMEAK